MKILIHDHAGHPFEIQLSRALAKRGHQVLHTFCSSVQTPRGILTKKGDDPDTFDILPIGLSEEFNKYGLFSRWKQEKELGQAIVKAVLHYSPDVIISANNPLRSQAYLCEISRNKRIKFVFWVQDALGVGIGKALRKKLPIIGGGLGFFFKHFERSLWKKSDEIVLITEDFLPYMPSKLVKANRVSVIENWAPLDELPLMPKSNTWSREHGLDEKFCLLYSGTLGMKHNPDLLLRLAIHLRERKDIQMVVISEGPGAEFLKEKKAYHGLDNLTLLPFQPFEMLPSVLASADILLAILESDAGVFAVPSKVLTYLCTKRALLLAVPQENLAARIVESNRAGIVVPPSDSTVYINAAMKLINDEHLRVSLAENGLAYAHKTFDINKITDKFEKIIQR
ncbi:glycosyltransferase family 4 protein [Desulfobacterales bacterium HSG2]|nr:glycosyltransferase family 4 protein [Desulfobacterales bacterium HSG2]